MDERVVRTILRLMAVVLVVWAVISLTQAVMFAVVGLMTLS